MNTYRRAFLASTVALCGAAALPSARGQARTPLAIPPLLDARAGGGEATLVVQAGRTEFYPGVASATAGYNAAHLGPTLRVHRGEDVRMKVRNRLAVDTTVHWHGLLVPGNVDGGPHQTVSPGGSWEPLLPIRQPGATLFYHSHVHHATAEQVYRGLAGMMIVHDPAEDALGLPSAYGVDDLPVILQDRSFDRGRLVQPAGMMAAMQGARGSVVLVNGTVDAVASVPGRLVRLRLVNGSNARTYHVAFSDRRSFQWIATDGGLLEAPLERRALSLMPGERAEIVVDFSVGGPAALYTEADTNVPMMGGMRGGAGRALPVLAFDVGPSEGPAPALPPRFVHHERVDVAAATRTRRFTLDMGMMGMGGRARRGADLFSINGRAFDMARVDEKVRLGDAEVWEVSADMMAHPFHVHGVHFRVIGRGGRGPAADDVGLKDTVSVRESVRLLARFTQPTLGHPYMYHCHILEHEDMGMMGQFEVS